MSNSAEEFLKHFGIPGMHWGKRKSQPHKFVSTEPDGTGEVRSARPHTMHLSNAQLQTRIARMKLENDYISLTTPAIKVGAGRKFATAVLNDSGKKVASKYASEYAIKGIDKAIAASLIKNIKVT